MKLPMPERYERLLRTLCLVLGGVLLVRLGWVAFHHNPLAHLKIPAVPALVATEPASGHQATNAPPGLQATKKSTNLLSAAKSTTETNSSAKQLVSKASTNAAPTADPINTNPATNSPIAQAGTNARSGTNALIQTNAPTAAGAGPGNTNSIALAAKAATNGPAGAMLSGKPGAGPPSAAAVAMLNPPQRPGPAKPLAPEYQARVDRITDSEILGPVMRPLPMALLGIAGNVAFLRGPNGQTGLVKEGDELAGLKLLRIGINRVLIEQEGQKKELTIFSGFGGESLLPK